ncbi:MAG: hypothetical protein VKL39_18525, partial [Leptolyngbyaceae bacterium]|nr:hypothetical protein [Leptolyngbyaceae bacterium]
MMEVLGYLYTAVEFEDAAQADTGLNTGLNGETDRSVAEASAAPSLSLTLPSFNWARTSSLSMGALLC